MTENEKRAKSPRIRNLIGFSAMIMLLFCVIVFYQGINAYKQAVRDGEQNSQRLAHILADHVELTFLGVDLSLRRAIEVDPKAGLAYDSLSKALSDSGRLPEAVETLRSAEVQFPEDSSFPAMRARLLQRMGRTKDAEQAARLAAEIMDLRSRRQALGDPK